MIFLILCIPHRFACVSSMSGEAAISPSLYELDLTENSLPMYTDGMIGLSFVNYSEFPMR